MRSANVKRVTGETNIELYFNVDGSGISHINTGVGFLDHMLCNFTRHGLFDMTLNASGDLNVDCHHTVEDIGIVLGQAIKEAIGDKKSIKRYGNTILPMDEALVLCALDLSGRPYFVSDLSFTFEKMGDLDTAMIKEFFYAISYSAGMNLHFKMFSGSNDHHIAECAFKAFAKALDSATCIDPRINDVLSTKGCI